MQLSKSYKENFVLQFFLATSLLEIGVYRMLFVNLAMPRHLKQEEGYRVPPSPPYFFPRPRACSISFSTLLTYADRQNSMLIQISIP
jgi:hypothetical protein